MMEGQQPGREGVVGKRGGNALQENGSMNFGGVLSYDLGGDHTGKFKRQRLGRLGSPEGPAVRFSPQASRG